jgi:hypothetical protein
MESVRSSLPLLFNFHRPPSTRPTAYSERERENDERESSTIDWCARSMDTCGAK